ncbi:hypothetical protein [Mycolicibacterium goodii]|uniref:hypothetical protein n=1 Tax=Mycolicibacterium goodii TaxID=134601 RepID=UPI001BDCD880|nr:hypothetical protein [Mycolicibacterium goodii]MBU8833600.1 hypothetical protein [Mycolicibacterium goodii]
MTLPNEMLDRQAPPGIRFLRAWLLPLGSAAGKRESGDMLPFTLIQRYAGAENEHTDYGYYQLDHLAKAMDGKPAFTACEDYARNCMRRLLYLRDHPWTEVEVPGWGVATADRVLCLESPHYDPYGDTTIERFISRYEIHLRLVRP